MVSQNPHCRHSNPPHNGRYTAEDEPEKRKIKHFRAGTPFHGKFRTKAASSALKTLSKMPKAEFEEYHPPLDAKRLCLGRIESFRIQKSSEGGRSPFLKGSMGVRATRRLSKGKIVALYTGTIEESGSTRDEDLYDMELLLGAGDKPGKMYILRSELLGMHKSPTPGRTRQLACLACLINGGVRGCTLCEPNCVYKDYGARIRLGRQLVSVPVVAVQTTRFVPRGSQLFADYGDNYQLDVDADHQDSLRMTDRSKRASRASTARRVSGSKTSRAVAKTSEKGDDSEYGPSRRTAAAARGETGRHSRRATRGCGGAGSKRKRKPGPVSGLHLRTRGAHGHHGGVPSSGGGRPAGSGFAARAPSPMEGRDSKRRRRDGGGSL